MKFFKNNQSINPRKEKPKETYMILDHLPNNISWKDLSVISNCVVSYNSMYINVIRFLVGFGLLLLQWNEIHL